MNHLGAVIWITGYSGAGKTTTGKIVVDALSRIGLQVFHFDGDEMRRVLGNKWGYSAEDRRELAFVYARMAAKLAENGVIAVCSVVAMFDEVREWNRKNCKNYLEVYLRVPVNVLAERDSKGLYKKYLGTDDPESIISNELETPKNPDIIVDNFGVVTPERTAHLVLERYLLNLNTRVIPESIGVNHSEIKNSITTYWNSFYGKRKSAPSSPSLFARFCLEKYITSTGTILEVGCGNGRDSFHFAKTNPVIAFDASKTAIENNRLFAKENGVYNILFHTGFFGEEVMSLETQPEFIYSRFVLHAMDEEAENNMLGLSHKLLPVGGLFLAEFRTVADPLAQEGVSIGQHEKITDHYRRFIDANSIIAKLSDIGFDIVYSTESRGLAPYKDEDPVVARIIGRRL